MWNTWAYAHHKTTSHVILWYMPACWFFVNLKASSLISFHFCSAHVLWMNTQGMLSCLRWKKMSRSILLLLISTSNLNQPSVSLKLEQRAWLWQTLCVQLPVYVGSCWLLEKYENRVTEDLSVQNYRFNGPGVRRSAVRRRSSLATISIRLFCKNNINLSEFQFLNCKNKVIIWVF